MHRFGNDDLTLEEDTAEVASAAPPGEEACSLLAPFRHWPPGEPFVIAQIGQSLDGRIATVSGQSRDINGAGGLDHLHRIRARVDAVVVGAGTIVADNPRLTVRRVPGKSPARVVIDPAGRLGSGLNWLNEDGARRVLITANGQAAPRGAEVVRLDHAGGWIAPQAILKALFGLGFKRILIEGGARTINGFLKAGCLDRLHILVAPLIIGSGTSGIDLPPQPNLSLAMRPKVAVHLLGGGDVLFDCDLSPFRKEDAS